MEGQSSNEGSSSTNVSPNSCDSTVELNIKTLDPRIYNFQVEKNMPVSLLKEKIANEIGVPANQQRLIFRGKVLKDELVLSEYLGNGHTLHLVERQPNPPQISGTASVETITTNSNRGNDAGSGAPRNRVGQISHGVVLGTFNVGEQVEGTAQDLTRVIGAVLNSIANGGQSTINFPNSTQHSSAPIWWADLAPQHGIEQGESDPNDLAWRRNASSGNVRPMRLDQFYDLLEGLMQHPNRISVQMLMRYVEANGRINGLQQNDSTWWSFISFAAGSVRDLSPTQHKFLLILFAGILSVLTKTCTTRFESFQVGKITDTPEETFYAFFLEVAHIISFIICWIITFILILPLQHALQIFFGLLCSAIIYFVRLEEKTSASGVHVACGDSFKLPLFWFAIIHAVGFSLIIGLMVFLIAYLSWEFIHKGNPRVVEVSLQILVGMLLTFSVVFYLAMPWLNDSASGVFEACGGLFKLPTFWFAILKAVGFFLSIGLVIILTACLSWKFIHKGNPRAVEVSLIFSLISDE
ncbi:uncharacterized protein LOC131609908 isoform X2 [Vicia villosa]|uniref:uncharacterized protein LOC131609908 isoform X2 n=1 Tax=Vicia villosa TaxID=3911 RepID=UPI00273B9806|nr:uncharacterized protein LOC131609908 isoform X2 [Vicia villosa]